MKLLAALLFAILSLVSTAAHAQRGSSFFCIASDDRAQVYYHSDTFKGDPSVSTEAYQQSFDEGLKAEGKTLPSNCTFTDRAEAIPAYLEGLKQQCSDCSVWTLQRVAWTPAAMKPKEATAAAGAPFPVKDNALKGQAACSAFTEENYRQLALSGEPDTQLKTMCGQAFEFYTMYKRAIDQGYSEADANRTYAAHEAAARNAISFYENNKAD